MAKINSKWSLIYWIRKIGASLFFLGYFPFASGTIGSLVGVAGIWYAQSKIGDLHSPERLPLYWGSIFVLVAISIFLSSRSKDVFGSDDSSRIIIDEVAGQVITFFMIPISIKTLLIGFLLFRFFDIVKPFPINDMQELDGGVGVTMDDVLAGVFANICLFLILGGYQLIRSYL
ncbi:MAG TPA: phosphatidylglycerophosphatase A [Chitinispirillaceae bacterium]|nr:phosphatidylglycerophosphatase A [Chitinispirillaceae bacterium]